ncbi:uncharacterized protein LOC129233119 [Uloborus diversus]|uniref:uncharacterized protein LOC129233119 n=1 Tax=Uloborus diversus TaxID=327109 RepID=UPI00240977C0|nr:uncharacterized protein LOC129233119 [Uloborus diversus]
MINVDESQRDLQRIVWKNSKSEEVKTYRLCTVTYGTTSAPYLAMRCLKQLSVDGEQQYPKASIIVKSDFYMDDVLTGAADLETAKDLKGEIIELLGSCGMHLHKWCGNHPELIDTSSDADCYDFDKLSDTKTLGLLWKSQNDVFAFNLSCEDQPKVAKRTVLSKIARIFDPLGLLGPIVTKAKIILQRLWKLKVDWDESLPKKETEEWLRFIHALKKTSNVYVDRYCLALLIAHASDPRHQSEPGVSAVLPPTGPAANRTARRCTCRTTPLAGMRPAHRRTDSDGCSCQSTGSEESCSLTDDYPSDTTTSSTRSNSLQAGGGGGRGAAPHTVLSGWNFYSSHHPAPPQTQQRGVVNGHRATSQERVCCSKGNPNHRRCSSGSSSNHSKRAGEMDSGYSGGPGSLNDSPQEPFFLHEPNMTSDDRVKKLFDNKTIKKKEDLENGHDGTITNGHSNTNTNGSQIVTVEVHHSSASEDSNSVSDVSDPLPDYDDQGSQSSSNGNINNCNGTNGREKTKRVSREASSLSTDEGIYHEGDDDEDDDLDHELNQLVPNHHNQNDEEDDEDELHDNEVSFSPHHQEDLVAIRNKRPPPEEEHPAAYGGHAHASRRASGPIDAPHEDSRKNAAEVYQENGTLKSNHEKRTISRPKEKKLVEPMCSPPPPPPPLPVKKTEEQKSIPKPPSPPPAPKSLNQVKNSPGLETIQTRAAPPPPPPPDLPPVRDIKVLAAKSVPSEDSKGHPEDDRSSQKSDESSVEGEGKRYIKATATRKNSHQRTLPFIPPQFGFPPDSNENIRPSEYLRQAKGGSKNSTLKSNSTLHRAVSLGELAVASRSEKMTYSSRTESHETLLESDSRSRYVQSPTGSTDSDCKQHAPLSSTNSNGNTPLFNITVEQLQTVHLKKTDKPSTPERTVLLQKNDLIAELKQTKDIQGVRKMKEERSRIGEEIYSDVSGQFKAENFVSQIPEVDANGCVIPPWKRQMLAKKAAEKAKKEAEEQRLREAEAKKLNSIPPWKRQLLQRKEPASPVTTQSIHRTVSQPVVKSVEVPTHAPPEKPQIELPAPITEQVTDTQNEDSDDIPPNPWLQQLRKTKSVFR